MYVMFIHMYIFYIPNIYIYIYVFVLYFRINHEKIAQIFTDGYKITGTK
jgi:hypothetical protein